jgi:hypothetical protein
MKMMFPKQTIRSIVTAMPVGILTVNVFAATPSISDQRTPEGMAIFDTSPRFVHIRHAGEGWDRARRNGADDNLRNECLRMCAVKSVTASEHLTLSELALLPTNALPAVVFLTGKAAIDASDADRESLRKYCVADGGILFADNGGGQFHEAFTNLMQSVLPDAKLEPIPHDDGLFRYPFVLAHGAPLLWGRGRVLGAKVDGRWAVIYHQGEIADAWGRGHAGTGGDTVQAAFDFGVNVMAYAYRNQTLRRSGKAASNRAPEATR